VATPAPALVDYTTLPFGTNGNLPAEMVTFTSDPEFHVEYVLAAHIFGLLWNVQVRSATVAMSRDFVLRFYVVQL
jgi:hypothetical protein